jgi:hypothetical protein
MVAISIPIRGSRFEEVYRLIGFEGILALSQIDIELI